APVQQAPVQATQQAPAPAAPVQTQNTIPSNVEAKTTAPAAIKNPIDVDNWLEEELKDSKPTDEQFFTFYKKNEDFQKLLDEEYENYKRKFDTNATSLKVPAQEIAAVAASAAKAPADDKTMIYDSNIAKAEQAFEELSKKVDEKNGDLFGESPVTDFDKMIFEGTKDPDENEATLVITNEELKKEIDEVAKKVEEAVSQIEYDAEKRQKDLDDMAAARLAYLNKDSKEDLDRTSALEIKSIFDEWDKQRQEAEDQKNSKKKGGFGRFLLILLLLIALFIGADLAVISFVDDSPIRDFFYNVNIEADKVLTKIEDRFSNLNFDFLHKKEEDPEPVVELTDQEKIIQACNTNIEKVSCDVEGSKYSKDGKYGYNNLGSCTIVTDEDIINAATEVLVKYNCAWIDYVNTGSDISCFDYLKADGEAFRLASSFDGVGKIKEEFKSLNIGEIRQDSKDIFVFADEDILVKNGSSTTEVPSRLVYRMTKVGDDYKIVEYDDYGNNN
ncbi:MAG: hypothetical protein Q4F55_01400, partial [Bacillota bacterium]|nr:hypothetical protein [Bacillota bacterium]